MSDNKLGALWINNNKFNENSPAMTGVLEIEGKSIKVVVFKNESKLSERSPDYNIVKSREKSPDGAPAIKGGAAAAREYAKKVNEELDIPF